MYFRFLIILALSSTALLAEPAPPPTGAPDPEPSATTRQPVPNAPEPAPAPAQLAELPYIHPKQIPPTSCDGACAAAAERERASRTPEPGASQYRLSLKQSAAMRNAILQSNHAQGLSKKDDDLTFKRDELVSLWKDAWPKGSYNDTDLADVLAKFWIYSWAIGGGADLSAITEPIQTAVRSQFHIFASTDKDLSALTESQRQALAEHLMRLHAARWMGMMMVAKYHDELVKMMRGARTDFEGEFGYDVTTLVILPGTGFVLKK